MPSCADPSIAEGEAPARTEFGGRGSPLVIERCTPASVSDPVAGSPVSFAEVHARMLADQGHRATGALPHDQLLLFSPDPVVTLGSGAAESDLLIPRTEYAARGVALSTVDRGGEATYHGPGQRVGYLNVGLAEDERDLHALLRAVEGALIDTLAQYDVIGTRVEGRTGVWVEDRKIASIGLSVRRWVTGHGFALCVDGDLAPFDWIVPCGMQGCRYTTLAEETGAAIDRDLLDSRLAAHLGTHLGRKPCEPDLPKESQP